MPFAGTYGLKKINSERMEITSYEEVEDTLAGAENIEEEFYNFSRAQLLFQKHLVKMSSTCRKILQHFLDGMSFREITEVMNYENESYARKRKYRCVKLLVKRIKSDPDYNTIYDDDHK